MKLIKTSFCIGLILLLASLTACGRNNNANISPSPIPSPTTSTQTTTIPQSVLPPEELNASTADDILFAAVKNISGIEKTSAGKGLLVNDIKHEKITMTFSAKDKQETLNISVTNDFPTVEPTNRPVQMTLKISSSQVVYTREWNDNVYLFVTDFNSNDKLKDICVVSTGTGVGTNILTIYRYDGKDIYEYAEIDQYSFDDYYDGKGKIYFISQAYFNSDDQLVNPMLKVFDYDSKEVKALE